MHTLIVSLALTVLAAPPASVQRQGDIQEQVNRHAAQKAARAARGHARAVQRAAAERFYQQIVLPREQAAAMLAWQMQQEEMRTQAAVAMAQAAWQGVALQEQSQRQRQWEYDVFRWRTGYRYGAGSLTRRGVFPPDY